jgi:hypothetical protein
MSKIERVLLILRCSLLVSVLVSLVSLPSFSFGQQHGGIPLRIEEGPTPRCINYNTDKVWLTLYRVVITKKSGWFTSDNQAEIVLNVQVKTQPQSDKTLAFPLSSKVNIREYGAGQVSIPVEYTLVSGLALKQGTGDKAVAYTGFGLDTTVVNLKGKHGLGVALDALDQIVGSKKLPIPDNPYSQAAGYLLDFANKAVTDSITNQNADDKYTTASLALNFDSDGTCTGNSPEGRAFETTGTKAILMSDGVPGPGYVPIDKTDDYCWAATTQPSFVLKAAPKVGGKPCRDPSYSSKLVQVTNNFVAYFLQKRQVSGHLGVSNAARDKKESLQLCGALGLPSSECRAAD